MAEIVKTRMENKPKKKARNRNLPVEKKQNVNLIKVWTIDELYAEYSRIVASDIVEDDKKAILSLIKDEAVRRKLTKEDNDKFGIEHRHRS